MRLFLLSLILMTSIVAYGGSDPEVDAITGPSRSCDLSVDYDVLLDNVDRVEFTVQGGILTSRTRAIVFQTWNIITENSTTFIWERDNGNTDYEHGLGANQIVA